MMKKLLNLIVLAAAVTFLFGGCDLFRRGGRRQIDPLPSVIECGPDQYRVGNQCFDISSGVCGSGMIEFPPGSGDCYTNPNCDEDEDMIWDDSLGFYCEEDEEEEDMTCDPPCSDGNTCDLVSGTWVCGCLDHPQCSSHNRYCDINATKECKPLKGDGIPCAHSYECEHGWCYDPTKTNPHDPGTVNGECKPSDFKIPGGNNCTADEQCETFSSLCILYSGYGFHGKCLDNGKCAKLNNQECSEPNECLSGYCILHGSDGLLCGKESGWEWCECNAQCRADICQGKSQDWNPPFNRCGKRPGKECQENWECQSQDCNSDKKCEWY